MKKFYYKVYLEVALLTSDYVFGFINISHIPYLKLEEIFKEEITKERFLFDDIGGYIITKELYNKYKDYLDKQISFNFDFTLFQYSVGLCSVEIDSYQKDYHDELPPFFKK